MFFTRKKTEMPARENAPKGRSTISLKRRVGIVSGAGCAGLR